MQELLSKYGLYGIIISGLCWGLIKLSSFILKLMKDHKEERKEWKATNDEQTKETNRIIRENTNILSELTTLLKNRK